MRESDGNIYILDLAHDALMRGAKKTTNFIAYMKAIINNIIADNNLKNNFNRVIN